MVRGFTLIKRIEDAVKRHKKTDFNFDISK